MTTRILTGRGTFDRLADIAEWDSRSVFVVASAGTAKRLMLDRVLPPGARLFSQFRPNPTFEQALAAARARHVCDAELVVGIGGGSALDVAKAARALPVEESAAADVLDGRRAPLANARLILVPTTAGPGSEVTRFAALYRGSRKFSLDAPDIQADTALVDPALTDCCGAAQTWSCAFDALAHAVESLWSTRSTEQSRRYAEAALSLLIPILRDADPLPSHTERDRLSEAAILAGQAIDRTRTTAAHALAYPLTSYLGLRHGHACALNLTWLATMIEAAEPGDLADARGPDAVVSAIATLRRLFGAHGQALGQVIQGLLRARGLPTRCHTDGGTALVDIVVAEGLASNRISGTPIVLHSASVAAAMGDLLRPRGGPCGSRAKELSDV
ncbi:iron-containing alcohol dehydrogenase [Nocardia sp. NPDC051052]|uniref:iron-containing alcohol dehydrogenase n=1 Tax=Nocardia sp. NPDC051052 TaxID=3364322 RepID=UPI0037B3C87A